MCVGTGHHEQGCVRGIPPKVMGQKGKGGGKADDEQKAKCREAAKARRSKESEYFQELENLLPIPKQRPVDIKTHLDKTSLIR